MMHDEDIINGIKEYFDVRELVDKKTFKAHGQKAWQFLDIRTLHCLLIIREEIYKGRKVPGMETGLPITVNNWLWDGPFSQRGLRTNICQILLSKILEKDKFGAWVIRRFFKLYLSAHIFGKAFDFDVKGMTSVEVREWIIDNQHLFPYKIRLENKKKDRNKKSKTYGKLIPINWVHMDTFWLDKNPQVYLFNV